MNKNKKNHSKKNNNFRVIFIAVPVLLALIATAVVLAQSPKTVPGQTSSKQNTSSGQASSKQSSTGTTGNISQVQNGDLVIPISEISDKARFYPVTVDGTKLEVIAVKAPDGTIRTAFNTCQVCYDSGRGYYKQEGNQLVCQNCGNRFNMSQVQVTKGGCNPVPIMADEKTVDATNITISKGFLQQAKVIFQNWKS